MGAVTNILKEEHRFVHGLILRGIRSGESLPEAVQNALEAYKVPESRPDNEVARLAVAMFLQGLGFTNLEVSYDPSSGKFKYSGEVVMSWPDPPKKHR